MITPLPFSTISSVLAQAIRRGVLSERDDSVIFYDLSRVSSLVRELRNSFPADALHAVAIKANPLVRVLTHLEKLGCGAEAASIGELYLAKAAGFDAERIVFDSPAKTRAEILFALNEGFHLNADSFSELKRIDEMRVKLATKPPNVGVRLNPQLSGGSVSYTFTAGKYSKFGITLAEHRQALLAAYKEYPFLNSIHVHIGSQSCAMATLVEGIKVILDFASEVRAHVGEPKIEYFDIGGGLGVSYERGKSVASFAEYAGLLRSECPELFSGEYRLITEFGRHLHATSGWVATRVEGVKVQSATRTAIVHVGADMFVRRSYNPGDWHHDFAVCSADGVLKSGGESPHTIAGPLCFSGDILARDIMLPSIDEGDYLIVGDIGAYTFSMWSRYNSRPMPLIVGYHNDGEEFETLKQRETPEMLVEQWK